MRNYIYRNYTVEHLFDKNYDFSGYGDVCNPSGKEYKDSFIFFQVDPSLPPKEQIQEIDEIVSKVSFVIGNNDYGRLIIFTIFEDRNRDWQVKNPDLFIALRNYNDFIRDQSAVNSKIKIFDVNGLYQEEFNVIDWKFFFTSQMIVSPKLSKNFKLWFNRQLDALDLKRKKCLILDCDNTLWGGVVGEEGTHGIKLGQDYPGICFSNFQKLLKSLSETGVILAVCSKNNLSNVQDVWRNNPNQIITDKVLSAYRINWQDKASNIKSIAEELNIGLDSLVFLDDNPAERALVKEFLPEVEVPEFPNKPYLLIDYFWEVYNLYFNVYELSHEDIKKTDQYKENFFRNESKKVFENIDDYLRSLDIKIDIMSANESNVLRIAQMTQKTNQFNLTTKRYSKEEIEKIINNGGKVYCAGVKDKFGDNGITIAAIIKEEPDYFDIDSYLLSCRILGRNIEKAVLLRILDRLIKEGQKPIRAKFIPTSKNAVASTFLDDVGFKLIREGFDGVKYYEYSKDNKIKNKDYYTISFS
ncbi:MAG: HAD-IIIC family phosphatase [Bergeyella sp.]|nr:HAD-IIIC family phosphatase [Bergeyella sp.]